MSKKIIQGRAYEKKHILQNEKLFLIRNLCDSRISYIVATKKIDIISS